MMVSEAVELVLVLVSWYTFGIRAGKAYFLWAFWRIKAYLIFIVSFTNAALNPKLKSLA